MQVRKLHKILHDPLLLWEMEKELEVTCNGQSTQTAKENSSDIKVKFANVLRFVL